MAALLQLVEETGAAPKRSDATRLGGEDGPRAGTFWRYCKTKRKCAKESCRCITASVAQQATGKPDSEGGVPVREGHHDETEQLCSA